MLPPIDPATLEQNPSFKALYENLTSSKLGSDGSTIDVKKQKTRDIVRQKLQTARTEVATRQLLRDSLTSTMGSASELPLELQEVVGIVSGQLHGYVPLKDRELLEDDVDYFLENVTPISHAISTHLTTTALQLSKISHPDPPSSKDLPAQIPMLPTTATALRHTISVHTEAIASRRLQIANLATDVLSTRRALLEAAVRVLEQTVHGAVARASRARAEHFGVVARGLVGKLSIIAKSQPVDVELEGALDKYAAHLGEVEGELKVREQGAEEVLKGYERAGKGMTEIAKRYAGVCEEIEGVKGEIGRLEGKS